MIAKEQLRPGQAIDGVDMIFIVREYLEPVLELEAGTEALKVELAQRRDFSLAAAYNLFSRTLQAKIPVEDFLFALDRLQIPVNPRDIGHMYRRYDSDQDGRLGFWEFSNALLPVDVRYREEVEQRQAAVTISPETMDLLKRVLRRAVEAEAQAEGLRRKVAAGLKSGTRAVFSEIDRLNRGFLQKTDIKTAVD